MKTDDVRLTKANPDLKGFDLEALAGLGAFYDGSGGGIWQLAWEMEKLRHLRERMVLLEDFIRKYVLILARLSWGCEATVIHPTEKEGEDKELAVWAPQVELVSYTYDKQRVTAHEIAALWPEAKWRRSMPRWGQSETERDYTADVDGVVIRIKEAERLPRVKPVDRFGPCGPVRIGKGK